jgi:hypothetical protein
LDDNTFICAYNCGTLKTDVPGQALSPSFFFGTESGVVSYADDLGHCSEVQHLATAVDAMAFYEEKMRLIIITRSLFLSQLQVSELSVPSTLYVEFIHK